MTLYRLLSESRIIKKRFYTKRKSNSNNSSSSTTSSICLLHGLSSVIILKSDEHIAIVTLTLLVYAMLIDISFIYNRYFDLCYHCLLPMKEIYDTQWYNIKENLRGGKFVHSDIYLPCRFSRSPFDFVENVERIALRLIVTQFTKNTNCAIRCCVTMNNDPCL